jgi:hypothetical protein
MQSNRIVRESTAGDMAVDGLIAGLVAGLFMAVSLVVVGLVFGEGPALMLGRFDPNAGPSPARGLLLHLAVAGVYGLVYGLGSHLSRRAWSHNLPSWPCGLAYGLALFFLAELVLLPGAGSPLMDIMPAHFALAHVVYGLALAMVVERDSVD